MITFRSMNLETDAADMARIYSYTVAEPITAATARDWWTPRKDEIRITTLALDENGAVLRAVPHMDYVDAIDIEDCRRGGGIRH